MSPSTRARLLPLGGIAAAILVVAVATGLVLLRSSDNQGGTERPTMEQRWGTMC